MTDLRTAAQQALEALVLWATGRDIDAVALNDLIFRLEAALAEPMQEQDIEDAIEAAYWHFDARKKGLNEWASAPQSERDAFKAEARKLAKGYFPTQQAQDTKREMLAVADAFIRGKRAALADGDQLSPGEPVQESEQFDHGIGDDRFKVVRGAFWWHVLIGDGTKKYGKFHTQAGAEEMATLLLREFKNGAFVQHRAALNAPLAEPVQEPAAWRTFDGEGGYDYRTYEGNEDYIYQYIKRNGGKYARWVEPLYTAPPQRKPLTEEEIDALAMGEDGLPNSHIEFARAVERAHGIQ